MRKLLILLVSFCFFFFTISNLKSSDTEGKILTSKDMVKIKGKGTIWKTYKCLNSVRYCGQWSNVCLGLPNGSPCLACTDITPVVPCIKGKCDDICKVVDYIHCGKWVSGICVDRDCRGPEGSDCYLADCSG